jgi:hypothetical protein
MGMALSRARQPYRPAQFQRRGYRSPWLKSALKAADSSQPGRPEARDVAHPKGRETPETAARSIPKPGALETPSHLPRLNEACHNLVKRLESLHESCSSVLATDGSGVSDLSGNWKLRAAALLPDTAPADEEADPDLNPTDRPETDHPDAKPADPAAAVTALHGGGSRSART